MVKDKQVRELMKLSNKEESLKKAAMKAGMDPKTARKYLRTGKLPSEMKKEHTWRTRKDPFEEVWPELEGYLKVNPGIQAKTLFEYLQRQYPGRFQDGQRRTLERKVRTWRALEGPAKEVYFPQEHYPGVLSESDFTRMNDLNVTVVQGRPFHHMIYHFVLTYSNWETGSICFSESFESLSEGLQAALWELGGVTPGTPGRPPISCCKQQLQPPGVYSPLREPFEALQSTGRENPGRQCQRKRRCGKEPR